MAARSLALRSDRPCGRARCCGRALREFPDELKGEKYAVVGWGSVLKIPVVKKKLRQAGTTKYTRLALNC